MWRLSRSENHYFIETTARNVEASATKMNPLTDLWVRRHADLLPYHIPFEDSEENLSLPLSQYWWCSASWGLELPSSSDRSCFCMAFYSVSVSIASPRDSGLGSNGLLITSQRHYFKDLRHRLPDYELPQSVQPKQETSQQSSNIRFTANYLI